MADVACVATRGGCVLRSVVLVVAWLAGLSSGNSRHGTLAMAGRDSLCSGIRYRVALRLGLRLDRAGNTCTCGAATAACCSWVLPLCAQSDECRFRRRVDWAMGRLRTPQPHR